MVRDHTWGFFRLGLGVASGITALFLTGCGGSGHSPPPPPTLTSIAVTPANATIELGLNQQFSAKGTYSDGSARDISASVTWSSSETAIASMSASGLAATVTIGRGQIMATSAGINGSTRLIVVEGASVSVARFAYATNPTDNTISVYTVDAASGRLRANGYAQAGAVKAIAIDPAGKFAYAVDANGGTLTAFTIGAGGELTAVTGAVYTIGSGPNSLAVEPSGSFVYVTNGLAGIVSGYAIDRSSGKLTAIAGSPFKVTPRASVAAEALAIHPSGNFAYVTDSGANTVFAYTIDSASGALTAVAGSPFATGTGPAAIAIDPAGKVAIVANQTSGDVSTFTINSATGALAQSAGSPFATGAAPTSVGITPSGHYAYVADGLANKVVGFSIDSTTGAVAAVPGVSFTTGSSPVSVAVDASGRFVYVLNAGATSETITAYAIDAPTGNLAAVASIRTRGQGSMIAMSGGPAAITYIPKFAYVANNYGNTISAYSINPATGVLTNVAGSPFATGSSPFVAMDQAGAFLYSNNAAGGNISGFAIDQTSGGLTEVQGSPFAGGTLLLPQSIALDPTGRFAYVTNNSPISTSLAGFAIDRATGALTALAGSPFPVGATPAMAKMDPIGKFLYVTSAQSNNVSAFVVDASTGALAAVPGSPFATGTDPAGLTIDPTGQYVYVANTVASTVTAFKIDPASGALNSIAGSPYDGSTNPLALAVDGTGKYLYVANHYANNNVSAYSIDPATGILTPLAGSPFTAGIGPNDIEVDFSGKFVYVANGESGLSGDVSVFGIDTANGSLTQVSGSPFAAGYVPGSLVTMGQTQ
jgi:6-phosphogluconolactonase (cycloisomerase 2 family)